MWEEEREREEDIGELEREGGSKVAIFEQPKSQTLTCFFKFFFFFYRHNFLLRFLTPVIIKRGMIILLYIVLILKRTKYNRLVLSKYIIINKPRLNF